MRGSWGRYLPASWTHASVHPDLFTTECLLYLRDGECATRRSLESGRATPHQAARFGAAECRNVALPYFQLLHRIATSAYAFAAWEPARRTPARVLCHDFALRRNWPPTGRSSDVPLGQSRR